MKRLVPLLLMATIAITACANNSNPNDAVASMGKPKSSSTASTSGQPTSSTQAVAQFGQCMRSHGVSNFQDPVLRAGGQLIMPADIQTVVSTAAGQSAMKACMPLIAQIQQNYTQANPGQMEAAMRKIVTCLRSKGINVADPVFQNGQPQLNPPAGVSISRFQQAVKDCQSPSGIQP